MSLLFESTRRFENELAKFPSKDKSQIIEEINHYCSSLENGDTRNFFTKAYQPMRTELERGMLSTLYALPVNNDLRIILAVDDDPLFDQLIITLFDVVPHSSSDSAYKSIAESLYQNFRNGS